jgi:hypothetical protein
LIEREKQMAAAIGKIRAVEIEGLGYLRDRAGKERAEGVRVIEDHEIFVVGDNRFSGAGQTHRNVERKQEVVLGHRHGIGHDPLRDAARRGIECQREGTAVVADDIAGPRHEPARQAHRAVE